MAPQDLRLPTDSFVEPNDTDFYIMGRMEGKNKEPAKTDNQQADNQQTGNTDGESGHEIQ